MSVFTDVLAMADPAARAAFLDQVCAGNPGMRRRLDKLFAAHERAGGPLDRSPAEFARDEPAPAPTVIAGRYTLAERIGEGGMGTVYRAVQTEPVRRDVALKLVRSGMDSRAVVARFEAERQALALMDHPNIARVYDGGTTPSGQPFFVMELVNGVPLTGYCDQKGLSVAARLELFVSVCQAVQHAHQRGIIHRDLKPSNILVTEVDSRPTPKVIDFGVAKATGQKLTDLSFADTGIVVGTPTYMSPEQADPTSADIDTRTDVYALGVILYELLVGSPPLDARQFQRAAGLEMLRMVREVDPPRPSTRLSAAADRPNIAANRGIEPAKLARLLQGELDWVVMKALEKDRNRRYDTANGFARDVQRYLADEVVEARPPSAGYRLRKFVRRHKARVVAASLVVAALLTGIGGTTAGMVEAKRQTGFAESARAAETARADGEATERQRAEGEWRRAEQERQRAEQEQRRAEAGEKLAGERLVEVETEKRVAVAVRTFLQNKLLVQADPAMQSNTLLRSGRLAAEANRDVRVRELLDRAAAELSEANIETNFPNQPVVQAEILQTVGNTYASLSISEPAVAFLRRAAALKAKHLAPDNRSTLGCVNDLGRACNEAGLADQAVRIHEDNLKVMQAKLGPDDAETIIGTHNLAAALLSAGKRERALALAEHALNLATPKLGPDHPVTLACRDTLAVVYGALGDAARVLPFHAETVRLRNAKLGPDHPDALLSRTNLATAYTLAGKDKLAAAEYEAMVKLLTAKLGPDHRHTLVAQGNLALAYLKLGNVGLALPLHEEIHRLLKATLGPDHPDTLTSQNNLAVAYGAVGRVDRTLALLEESLKLRTAKYGPTHAETLAGMDNLALGYQKAGQPKRGLPLLEEALAIKKATLGPDDPSTLTSAFNLAVLYGWTGKRSESVALHEDTLKRRTAKLGRDHVDTDISAGNLAAGYELQGKPDLAFPLWQESYRYRKGQYGPDHPGTVAALSGLSFLLLNREAYTEAESHLRELLAVRARIEPDVWSTFDTQSQLGGALLGQKKYAEAEPLLLKGYEGMKKRDRTIPPPRATRIPDAIDRLIELSRATNKPDEEKRWRAERTKYPPAVAPAPREK